MIRTLDKIANEVFGNSCFAKSNSENKLLIVQIQRNEIEQEKLRLKERKTELTYNSD